MSPRQRKKVWRTLQATWLPKKASIVKCLTGNIHEPPFLVDMGIFVPPKNLLAKLMEKMEKNTIISFFTNLIL